MKPITVGTVTGIPGEVVRGELGRIHLADGTPVRIPLLIMQGTEPGPTLWVSAAMHGQEISGIAVIWQLLQGRCDPKLLRGTVVAVPVLNPLSFTGQTYFTPQDGYNLNRSFPGDPKGLLTARMAALIYQEGIEKCDYFVDFHCNPDPALCFTIIKDPGDDQVWQTCQNMARAFGITTIEMESSYEAHRTGTLVEAALSQGKPSVILELIPWRRISSVAVEVGVRGMLNIMRHLDMMDGEIEPQEGIPILDGRLTRVEIMASTGGLVRQYKTAGDPVQSGETIGHIVDLYGDEVEPVISPVDGWLLAFPLLNNQAVGTGDILAFFAIPKA
jgi:predicted deacylase